MDKYAIKIVGAITLIITITICAAYLLAVLRPLITGEPNPEYVAEALGTITGSMLAIVSLFVGAVAGIIGKTYWDKKSKGQD